MAKTGRPRIEIDEKIFSNLCSIQCTLDEIAGVFDCSSDTIERWCKRTFKDENTGEPLSFADIYKKYSAKGKTSLRRAQFKLAEKSAAMAIWLGKNYLGQTDASPLEMQFLEARIKALESQQGSGAVNNDIRKQIDDIVKNIKPIEDSGNGDTETDN